MKRTLGILALVIGMVVVVGQMMPTTRGKGFGVAEIRAAQRKIMPLQTTMPATQSGDWLDAHPESGQTFDQYIRAYPTPLADKFTTIYVQPIGDFSKTQQRLIDDTTAFLSVFFGRPVKTLAALPLTAIPESARRVHPQWGDKQILTGYVEKMMAKQRPEDALALIALTTSDLYPGEKWNFVFGEASYADRVGVWSVYRFGDPETDYTQVLRRTLKVASHETGHMLGIEHCTAYQCGMNGSNSLPEADRQPLAFCAECAAKVWYTCKTDPAGRYDALARFAEQHALKAEQHQWEALAAAVRK